MDSSGYLCTHSSINPAGISKLTEMAQSCGNVLMIASAQAGHATPMMYVGKAMMDRGISITVVIQEDKRALVEKDSESYMGSSGLMSLHLLESQSNVEGAADDRDGGFNLERACEPFFLKLLAEQESGSAKDPKCIVGDQFQAWTQVWADKLRIPRYVSFPSSAAYAVAMLCHTSIENQVDLFPPGEVDPNFVFEIPGLPLKLHKADIPKSFINHSNFGTTVVNKSGDSFRDAAGMLFNTFYELETEAIDGFHAQVQSPQSGKVPKMLPIGPMLPREFFNEDEYMGHAAKGSECLQWLNTRHASSVLYVAFGSMAYLTQHQIQELAHGLEASQVPFLWVLRVKSSSGEAADVWKLLPPGFHARVKDRGLVYTEFAPQLQILSHAATGGFLTHCGWNSCLESISRGIPMITWPRGAEQGLSCRIVVDLAKVAVEMKKEPDGSMLRNNVEKAIVALMGGPQGKEIKQRAKEMQHLARAAVSPGGSSDRNFNWLVKEILGQH